MSAGDLVVDITGRARRVRAVVPCGMGNIAEMHLRDGTALALGAAQELPVEVGAERVLLRLNAEQIAGLLARRTGVRLAGCDPIDMPGVGELPIAPGLLGLLLGDGGLSSPNTALLWTTEMALRDRAEQLLPAGSRFSDHPQRKPRCFGWRIISETPGTGNPLLAGLRQLGLSGCRSWEKHVPASYLWAPAADRLDLLHSLLDSDGGVDPAGKIHFSSASETLTRDVLHLARSLGGRGAIHVRRGITYTVKGQPGRKPARDSFRVTLCMRDVPPFTLERKAARVRQPRQLTQWQVAAVRMGAVAPLLALDVEGPTASYLADGFVPVASTRTVAATAIRVA